jgi:hypothetical protein
MLRLNLLIQLDFPVEKYKFDTKTEGPMLNTLLSFAPHSGPPSIPHDDGEDCEFSSLPCGRALGKGGRAAGGGGETEGPRGCTKSSGGARVVEIISEKF